jgi:dihydrofolate reductase
MSAHPDREPQAARPKASAVNVVLVAAMAENRVIGREGGLPWRLKSELKHFRTLTWGKPVVMGRKTFQSLPAAHRPLPGRTNVVVSRDPDFAVPGVVLAPDLKVALAVAQADARRRGTDALVVAGGADLYAQAMPLADEIALTLVHCRPPGDALFPAIDPHLWCETARLEQPAGPDDDVTFAYVHYRRRTTAPDRAPVAGSRRLA